MKIKLNKKFFSETEQKLCAAEQNTELQNTADSEEYYEALLAKIMGTEYTPLIPDLKRTEQFKTIAYLAEIMAEIIFLDILVETDDETIGKITLSGKGFIFPCVIDHKAKKIFALMIEKADDIAIYNQEEYLTARFIFDFCKQNM